MLRWHWLDKCLPPPQRRLTQHVRAPWCCGQQRYAATADVVQHVAVRSVIEIRSSCPLITAPQAAIADIPGDDDSYGIDARPSVRPLAFPDSSARVDHQLAAFCPATDHNWQEESCYRPSSVSENSGRLHRAAIAAGQGRRRESAVKGVDDIC